MARISKPPEERRLEIITAASELFNTNGYESTSVSDIVKKVGVAQGTFYYHFKSKEELLEALLALYVEESFSTVSGIIEGSSLNVQEKIIALIKDRISFLRSKQGIVTYVKRGGDKQIHDKLYFLILTKVQPLFRTLAAQGNKEDFFNVIHPDETFEIVFPTLFNFVLSVEPLALLNPVSAVKYLPKLNAYFALLSRILDIKKSKLEIFKTILSVLVSAPFDSANSPLSGVETNSKQH